jgi:membrane-bound serine protease (ClpP class)
VAGGICLLLAFFAFQVLPVSYAAVALILFGIALLVLEIKIASFGLLATGGVISLFLGSIMLIDSPLPELQIGLGFITPIVAGLSGIILFLVYLGVQAQRTRSVTGDSGMIGEIGQATTAIAPGAPGTIRAHGEIWTATSDAPIAAGQVVRIVAVKGLTVAVRPEGAGGLEPVL